MINESFGLNTPTKQLRIVPNFQSIAALGVGGHTIGGKVLRFTDREEGKKQKRKQQGSAFELGTIFKRHPKKVGSV